MLRIDADNSIHLTRGDTAYLQVPIYNDSTGEEYAMAAGDKLLLSVKRRISDATPCISKELTGTNMFHITPADTCTCEFTTYKYDVQLTMANGDVYTVIAPADFQVCQEVSV